MSLHPITLQTDKTITDFTKDFETVKQSEKGQVLQGTILNADKEPYDLSATGIYLVYCEQKSEGKMIIDKGNGKDPADDAGVMTITDAKNGKFSYKLCQQAYAATGDAWIEIYNGNDFVDSTESFRMIVEPAANIHYSNDNYVSDMANILTSLKAEFTRAKSTVDALEKDVSDTNSDIGQKLTALQAKVQHFQDQYAEIQNNYDAAMKKVTDQATTDTQNAVNAINGKYTANMKTLQDQFNSWEKTTTDNYTKQINDLIAQAKQNGVDVDKLNGEISNLQKSLGNIDLTQFIKPADLTNALNAYYKKTETYNRTEIDNKLASAGKVKTVDGLQPDSNGNIQTDHYTKQETDTKLASAGKVKTVNGQQPDSNGNITVANDGVKSFNGQKGDVTFKVNHTGYSSPQAAFDASKNGDGIYIYDADDGPTSVVIDNQTITVTGNHEAIVSLQQTLQTLTNSVSTKANASDLSAYAKKPAKASSQSDATTKSKDGNWYYW